MRFWFSSFTVLPAYVSIIFSYISYFIVAYVSTQTNRNLVNDISFQMSIVVVPKFSFSDFLESIVRHQVTHLLLSYLVLRLADTDNIYLQPCTNTSSSSVQGDLYRNLFFISDVFARILLPRDMILAM